VDEELLVESMETGLGKYGKQGWDKEKPITETTIQRLRSPSPAEGGGNENE